METTKCTFALGEEGNLKIEGAKTLETYRQLKYETHAPMEGCFFAFSDDICKPVKEKQPAQTAIQLSVFEPPQNQNLLRYRDEVAKEMLVHNFKNGVLSEDAVGYANRLVKRLYGIDLGCDTIANQ